MIKVVMCMRRREDVSEEEFHRYWREEHGPLVRSLAPAMGAVRYVQSHTIAPERNAAMQKSRGTTEPFDGLVEVWFESLASLAERFNSQEAREADRTLRADEGGFIDLGRSSFFLTEEVVFVG